MNSKTFKNEDGYIKGNCDAELVLQAMIDLENLVKYLDEQGKLLSHTN